MNINKTQSISWLTPVDDNEVYFEIVQFSFLVSLFSDSTAIYATYNSGGWYDFGFYLGVSSAFSATRSTISRSND